MDQLAARVPLEPQVQQAQQVHWVQQEQLALQVQQLSQEQLVPQVHWEVQLVRPVQLVSEGPQEPAVSLAAQVRSARLVPLVCRATTVSQAQQA